MIRVKNLNFGYGSSEELVLRHVNLHINSGDIALICGPTGSGKSSLLKCFNGLVPHFAGGTMSGEVLVNGKAIQGRQPRQLAETIGYVNQQPEGSFVGDTVEDELVYGMEQLGFTRSKMQGQLDWVCRRFDLGPLLERNLNQLSGGQQQKVAIAAALAAGQRVLLLDEPTSALSPDAAQEVLAILRDLAKNDGITVAIVEHRIERVLDLVDTVITVHGDGSVTQGSKQTQFTDYRYAPPLVELSQKLNWPAIATSLEAALPHWDSSKVTITERLPEVSEKTPDVALRVENLTAGYGNGDVIKNANFALNHSSVTALMGPNGSGKTTLLSALLGTLKLKFGTISTIDGNPVHMKPERRLRLITAVPQQASDLLFLNTVSKELAESDKFGGLANGTTARILESLTGRIDPQRHPRDLSAGQQLSLTLAIQLANGAKILLLDEPTRGLDYQAKHRLAKQIIRLRNEGHCLLVSSHDVEFVAQIADRVLEINQGQIKATSSTETALGPNSPHPTQLASLSQSNNLLTVRQVWPA